MIMSYEQEEYIREGLSWTRVGHASSTEVCDVMEKVRCLPLNSLLAKVAYVSSQ